MRSGPDSRVAGSRPRALTETSTWSRISQRTKVVIVLMYGLFLAALLLIGAEVALRMSGWRPWRVPRIPTRVHPGGQLFRPDPNLGYTHLPGRFLVDLGTGISFTVTHSSDSRRLTHLADRAATSSGKEQIWIFGCSYTYGWTLDDHLNYPWLLQQRFPEYEVVNFGTNGYGTVQSLLQFQEALKSARPRLAILAYADFHDERNTYVRARRKYVIPNTLRPLQQPYARLDNRGELRFYHSPVGYREFPFMRRSALVHFIESKYNQYEERQVRSQAVSQAIVEEMSKLAARHGVRFLLAGIGRHGKPALYSMLDFAQQRGIANVNIALDPAIEGHRNLPDNHPSALAHRKYADQLEGLVRKMMASSEPRPGTN